MTHIADALTCSWPSPFILRERATFKWKATRWLRTTTTSVGRRGRWSNSQSTTSYPVRIEQQLIDNAVVYLWLFISFLIPPTSHKRDRKEQTGNKKKKREREKFWRMTTSWLDWFPDLDAFQRQKKKVPKIDVSSCWQIVRALVDKKKQKPLNTVNANHAVASAGWPPSPKSSASV